MKKYFRLVPQMLHVRAAGTAQGFTLLEVLAALALLSIALAVILQLFSANLKGIAASDDYVHAVALAEAHMRKVLDDKNIASGTEEEFTDGAYRFLTEITEVETERTENLPVSLLEVTLTVQWRRGTRHREIVFTSMKVIKKSLSNQEEPGDDL